MTCNGAEQYKLILQRIATLTGFLHSATSKWHLSFSSSVKTNNWHSKNNDIYDDLSVRIRNDEFASSLNTLLVVQIRIHNFIIKFSKWMSGHDKHVLYLQYIPCLTAMCLQISLLLIWIDHCTWWIWVKALLHRLFPWYVEQSRQCLQLIFVWYNIIN